MNKDTKRLLLIKDYNAGYTAGKQWEKNGTSVMHILDTLQDQNPGLERIASFAEGYLQGLEHTRKLGEHERLVALGSLRRALPDQEKGLWR